MTDPRDPIARLEEAGARPAPPPDPAFADQLEARLRAAHPAASRSPGHRVSSRARGLVLAAAAVVVLAIVGFAITRSDDPDLTLSNATATDVILPDGSVVEGHAGLSLPDGAVVQTGDAGSASAGAVDVSNGDAGVVIDGELVIVDPEENGPTPTAVPTSVPRPTTTSTRPPPTTVAPSTTGAPPPARLEIRATRTGPDVVLQWTRYERPDFARYIVLRIQDDGAVKVAERLRPEATEAIDRPPRGPAAYRVVVLDKAGRAVGGSPTVRV